jgi:hypothetical protein
LAVKALLGSGRFDHFAGRTIQQFDQAIGALSPMAKAELQDAQIAAVAVGEARAQLVEQLGDDVAVAQAVEGQAAVGQLKASCPA